MDLAAALRARGAMVVARNERMLAEYKDRKKEIIKEEKNELYCLQHLSQEGKKK